MKLKNKNILIIGVSGGIGQNLIPYLESSYNIIGHFNKHKPKKPKLLYTADITQYNEVEKMVKDIIKDVKNIDILLNSAGICSDSFIHKSDVEMWQNIIKTNFIGIYNAIRSVLPYMRSQNYGRIINISSIVGSKPQFGTSAYSASKSALVGLTKTITIENASKGITCNNIALGYSEVGMINTISPALQLVIKDSIPLKRFCNMKELFNAIEFIINTEYYTGQTLNLDGGLT
jgi:NAD(P)-dependent dehydrogenase (short-subunit alcohol dehydrogenase family)